MVRCEAGSNFRTVSISSPKKSRRTGSFSAGVHRSSRPPRRENCPGSRTVFVRWYPISVRYFSIESGWVVCPTDSFLHALRKSRRGSVRVISERAEVTKIGGISGFCAYGRW